MRINFPLVHSNKYIFFLLLLLFTSLGSAQEKDTVLFIPKLKYQSKLLISKTDSINALKKRAVLTAKSSKDLSDRMAELDSILNSYKKETQRITKIIKADSVKVAKNKGRKRINIDSIKTAKQVKEDKDAARLARLNAIIRRNDSIKLVKAQKAAARIAKRKQDSTRIADNKRKLKLKNDSIRTARAQIAAKNRQDSIKIAQKLQQEKFRQDSIRVAQQKIIADQIAKRKQDSINTAVAQQKAQLRADSIRVAQQKILSDIIAKRKQDSINTAVVQQKAQLRADSIRVAQQKIKDAQLLKIRKQDSINTAITLQQKEKFIKDSIRVANLINNEKLRRKQDSINTAIAKNRLDSINSLNTGLTNNDAVNTNKNLNFKDSVSNPDLVRNQRVLDTMPFIRTGNILSKFVKGEIELQQGQIVSNVLKVVNLGRRPVTFTTELLIPGSWTRIDDENKQYIAKQNDTVIVPVIISPTKLVNGNTEIIINSFLIGDQQQQLANNFFSLKTKKQVSWNIELSEVQNMYLKNGEKKKRFSFQIHNSGNYKQDLFVNYSIPKKDLFLSDTLGKIIKQPNTTFTLGANERKSFDFLVSFKDLNKRNFRRVSQDSYDPYKKEAKKTHNLIINSSEPRLSKKGLQKRTKVNFIRLPNELKANPYGYPYLPLTVRLSAQNILDDRSFLSLSLRGFKQLNENSSLLYSTDISYSNSYFTNGILKNAPWYVGYFDNKKSIEVGQISGNLLGIASNGKGIKGSYLINDQHQVGAFYTNSGGFAAGNSSISFGAWHKYIHNEDAEVKTQIGRNINSISNRSINVLSIQPSIRFNKKYNVSLISSFTNKKQENEPAYFKANGLMLGSSFSTYFLKKRLRVNLSARYNDRNFGFGNYDRFTSNSRITYRINQKWNTFLSNNYQNSSNFNVFTGDVKFFQETFYNNLVFNTRTASGTYQPGIFYEYRNYPNSIIHNRGLTFRYSNYNFNKNLITSLYLRAGYTKPTLNNTQNKDYFNFELSSLTRFRTWNFNAKYNLGAFSTLTSQQTLNDFITPQSIRLSAQNQYLFASRNLLIDSNVIYSYNNVFSNHTLGVYPTVYFFNKTGWRFGMSANYTFSTSDFSTVFDNLDNEAGNQFGGFNQSTTSNFNLNFSLKKDFGIPIPFVDRTAATGNFVAFLDLNGNGIKEEEETTLENVVIKVGKKEILTNLEGKATMLNLLKDVYDVVLDRQKIAVADKTPMDLSRIKISATKGEKVYGALTNNSGRFEFYLPYGDYVITMDEGILNSRLRVTRNNIPLKLKSTQDGVYVSFYIIEKRRKVIFTDFSKKKN